MTVQPTHQDANGRKFVKVGELPVPTRNYAPEIWQEVNTGEVVHRYPGGGFYSDGDYSEHTLTPIPQPEVRWIGVSILGCTTATQKSKQSACRIVSDNGWIADYIVKVSTLNGVRTASVEAP